MQASELWAVGLCAQRLTYSYTCVVCVICLFVICYLVLPWFRFSLWATQPKARDTSKLTQYQQIQLHQQQQLEQQAHLQQQRQANGQDHKRKQEQPAAAAAAGSTAQQQQQQQPAQKHQRLERPGKHTGASAAMVVGIQVIVTNDSWLLRFCLASDECGLKGYKGCSVTPHNPSNTSADPAPQPFMMHSVD